MRWTHCFGLIGVAMLASACEPREDSRTEVAIPVWSEDDEMIVAVVDEWTASSDPECKSSCGTCRGIQPGQSFRIAIQKGPGGESWILAEGGEGFVGEYYLMRDRGYVVGNVTRPFDEWGGEKLTVEAWDVSTGEHSVLLKVKTRTTASLEALISQIRSIEGVERTETMVVLSTHTERVQVPLAETDTAPVSKRGRRRPRTAA